MTLSEVTRRVIGSVSLTEPLIGYPWLEFVQEVMDWSASKDPDTRAFIFDVLMSLAYIDSLPGLSSAEFCTNAPEGFNAHLGFINLCTCCFHFEDRWQYQLGAKPRSAVIGKLSSELIVRFLASLYPNLKQFYVLGGTSICDAVLVQDDGIEILCEVKASPLITFPLVLDAGSSHTRHSRVQATLSQIAEMDSGLYLHEDLVLPLGLCGSPHWPFEEACRFLVDPAKEHFVNKAKAKWLLTRYAYETRDRSSKDYFLANASGKPPVQAIKQYGWPKNESISDGKTSSGLDRTDDIKKGIYQTMKLGLDAHQHLGAEHVRTALVSNLPALRHGEYYVEPFVDFMWAYDFDLHKQGDQTVVASDRLFRPFDYLITLVDPILRGAQW